MENCLVTKLKAAVNNNNLDILNVLKVRVNRPLAGQEDPWLRVSNSKPFKVYTKEGGFTYNDTHYAAGEIAELPQDAECWIQVDPGEYSLCVTEKYTLVSITANNFAFTSVGWDIDAIKDYTTIGTMGMVGQLMTGDVASLSTINDLFINNTKITGDIECFAGRELYSSVIPGIVGRQMLAFSYSPLTGDIVNLSGIRSSIIELNVEVTSIYGTIESLIDAIKVNRSTGALSIYADGSNVTYTGHKYSELSIRWVSYNFETGVYTTGVN